VAFDPPASVVFLVEEKHSEYLAPIRPISFFEALIIPLLDACVDGIV